MKIKPPVIPKNHLREVCKPGHGADTCRYITAGPDGICCEKHSALGRQIDSRVHQMIARGDNCEGLE